MKQYLEELYSAFGTWEEDFKVIIEKANPSFEEDFGEILLALPEESIPNFLEWMINMGYSNLISNNIDNIMNCALNYSGRQKVWIEKSINLLGNIEDDSKIAESISSSIMLIIKNIYKRGDTWTILKLCESCKDIGDLREVIEQNYEEIIETIFSNNDFLSNNKALMSQIKSLIYKVASQENIRLSDIEHIGSGQYSNCIKIGDSVLKFGKNRILDDLPTHKRILQPKLRINIPKNYKSELKKGRLKKEDILAIECQDIVDTKWYEVLDDNQINEKLYEVWKDLRNSDIIWTDIKPENVGRLLKPNVVDYEFKDSNGESITRKITLPAGELVIFDTDRIYKKEKLPDFNKSFQRKSEYEEFEERFIKEREENQNR